MIQSFEKLGDFFTQYDREWLSKFLFSAFGKYTYVHTLSERGLDCYLSNLRNVQESHPDDMGCVKFYAHHNLYNMVDFRDADVFLHTFQKYYKLKAFL